MNRVLIGWDMLEDMQNEMNVIMNNLKVGQDRQKSYEDHHKEFNEFHIGEDVYLSIKPKKSSLMIGSCAKLAP